MASCCSAHGGFESTTWFASRVIYSWPVSISSCLKFLPVFARLLYNCQWSIFLFPAMTMIKTSSFKSFVFLPPNSLSQFSRLSTSVPFFLLPCQDHLQLSVHLVWLPVHLPLPLSFYFLPSTCLSKGTTIAWMIPSIKSAVITLYLKKLGTFIIRCMVLQRYRGGDPWYSRQLRQITRSWWLVKVIEIWMFIPTYTRWTKWVLQMGLDRIHEDEPPMNASEWEIMNENNGGIFVMVGGTTICCSENVCTSWYWLGPRKIGSSSDRNFWNLEV